VSALPTSPASERNKQPILEVLREEFRDRSRVLEIGSGTGQHAVCFGAAMPHLRWQTSDLPENHDSIRAWLAHAGLGNVKPPLVLDVETFDGGALCVDAVFSANTAHIMSFDAVRCMFRLVGELLPAHGVFCLYGPFSFDGRYSSDSNAEFDASLKQRNPSMGIRDLAHLDRLAQGAGMSRVRLYAMPANNHIVVWQKGPAVPAGSKEEKGE
jgi:cyclopropane fatty-acyl-phospholipid synthase-like methyltransferase